MNMEAMASSMFGPKYDIVILAGMEMDNDAFGNGLYLSSRGRGTQKGLKEAKDLDTLHERFPSLDYYDSVSSSLCSLVSNRYFGLELDRIHEIEGGRYKVSQIMIAAKEVEWVKNQFRCNGFSEYKDRIGLQIFAGPHQEKSSPDRQDKIRLNAPQNAIAEP